MLYKLFQLKGKPVFSITISKRICILRGYNKFRFVKWSLVLWDKMNGDIGLYIWR